MNVKISNPTQCDIENVSINGKVFNLKAGEEISLSKEDAKAWVKLHGFLLVNGREVPQPNYNPVLQDDDDIGVSDKITALDRFFDEVGDEIPAEEELGVVCPICDKALKSDHALAIHMGRFHKEEKQDE